jgi:hypothetical protein
LIYLIWGGISEYSELILAFIFPFCFVGIRFDLLDRTHVGAILNFRKIGFGTLVFFSFFSPFLAEFGLVFSAMIHGLVGFYRFNS